MKNTILDLPVTPSYVLVDGNKLPKDLPTEARAVVKGDATVYCIAAASILAKVTRDRYECQPPRMHNIDAVFSLVFMHAVVVWVWIE